MSRRLRVVQWTTGKTGSAAVKGMVGHPVLDLVGCYAYSPDKVGRDVGELCGIAVLDHVVVGADGFTSLAQEYWTPGGQPLQSVR